MTNEAYRRLKVCCIVGLVAGALLGLVALPYVGSTGRTVADERMLAPSSMGSNTMNMIATNLW